jgi:hypothetical protein
MSPAAHPERGLSLLELLAAIALFSVTILMFVSMRNDAVIQASDANDLRILRYLAEYQIGELRLGYDAEKNEFETGEIGGTFEHLGAQYAGYRWTALIEEVVAAGTSTDDEIPNLFPADEDDEYGETAEEESKPVTVVRITLHVKPEDASEEEEGVEIVTFKPASPEDADAADGGG